MRTPTPLPTGDPLMLRRAAWRRPRLPLLTPPRAAPSARRPLQDEVQLNGAIVLPHKDIKESIMEPGTIIM